MELNYVTRKEDSGKKLKQILKEKLFISNILLNKLKESNGIFVNGKAEFVNYILNENDKILLLLPHNIKKFSDKFVTVQKDFNILYEDDYLLVVNKEANMPVHPSTDNYDNTLANVVAYYLEQKGTNGIHIITRLDKNTSGICIFAKNEYIQELFIRKKEEIGLYKEYICIVDGILKNDHEIIEKKIARKQDTIILREVNENGDYAKTEYYTLARNMQRNYSIVKVILHTGRTHQIRVHMASISHVLLGCQTSNSRYYKVYKEAGIALQKGIFLPSYYQSAHYYRGRNTR
ncbi:MAG: RluA family pseudouridine synthase [Clostridia bacterium]|nr:RluA family pseudouridine synthase [Clostridia bacterium]